MNLCAQLESICTNSVHTNKLLEKLVNIVLKLSDEIRILWKDDENLNIRLDHISATECCCRMSTTPGATCRGAPPPAAKASEPKSYRNVLTPCSTSILYLANPSNPKGVHMASAYDLIHEAGICDDGFSMVVKKIRNNLAISPILPIQRCIKA